MSDQPDAQPVRTGRVRPVQRTPRARAITETPEIVAPFGASAASSVEPGEVVPLDLSPDAVEGTRDRLIAMGWMDADYPVRRRGDGVYERMRQSAGETATAPAHYEYYPDIEMLDRRVLEPSIEGEITILFKDEENLPRGAKPLYYKRWVDTFVPHRLLTLTQRARYMQATWDMLANESEIGDRVKLGDAYVRRGDKGRFMLLFMPYASYVKIKTAQAQQRVDRERKDMKRIAASRAAAPRSAGGLGDGEAGDKIDTMFRGSIRELPPQSVESFEESALPKDMR